MSLSIKAYYFEALKCNRSEHTISDADHSVKEFYPVVYIDGGAIMLVGAPIDRFQTQLMVFASD